MTDDVGTIAGRLRMCAEMVGSGSGLAERARIPRRTFENYVSGAREPKLGAVTDLARAAGVNIEWLVAGIGPMRPGDDSTGQQGNEVPAIADGDDFAKIRRLSVQASAGNGALAEREDDVGTLAFRTEWLHRRGINPKAARALTARGDSMEPTIRDGDILLVDTSIDRVMDNAIYVVVLAGLVLVKRIQVKRDGSLRLTSDNSAVFDAEDVPASEASDIRIAGRVMWFGRSI